MPDINALLGSLHKDRMQRREATEAFAVPALAKSPSASSSTSYEIVPLLVLDLDGTLLDSACPGVRQGVPSFTVDGMLETRLRPGIDAFFSALRPLFEFAVFTAANAAYAERMIDGIDAAAPGFRASLKGRVFSRERVDFHLENGRVRITKDLRSLARHCGYPMCRCLIVDDTPETYRLNPSNALPVPIYNGTSSDRALDYLREFLLSLPCHGVPLDVGAWPLGPRGAQPLLDEQDGGHVLVSAPTHASITCGRQLNLTAVLAPEVSPAFLPLPEDHEMLL
jgi:TFIIF-interacting CTD phosphatase-like protein